MLSFLKSVFGSDVSMAEYKYKNDTPYYIRDGYTPKFLIWNQGKCIILKPNDSNWRLPTLKKQLKKFQELCEVPCALCLENLTALQRRNLVENNIPFISLSQQVYLPFWGCSFHEQFKAETLVTDKMAPGTQLVFLYLYYGKSADPVNLTQLSKDLSLSKATCTRAINDLLASGLIMQSAEGTNKWITLAYGKPEFLKKGYARLKSPIERILYVKTSVQIEGQVVSGIRALAQQSMIGTSERDGAFAVSKKTATGIPANDICTEQYFGDFGGSIVEVWSYDPAILAENMCVDDISLLLSMENDPNERVQMCLDDIREKHELPVKEEE
jgi:hypothetical protein